MNPIRVLIFAVLYAACVGCSPNADKLEAVRPKDTAVAFAGSQPKTLGHAPATSMQFVSTNEQPQVEPVEQEAKDQRPVVLFNSYHAHNFLYRGLVPGEYLYHQYTGFRRASKLLEARGCDVQELLIGPVTAKKLQSVRLLVINLPSMDRPTFVVDEVLAIEDYVRRGGGLVIITDHTNCYYHQYHLLPLFERLGIVPTFETLCDPDAASAIMKQGPGWVMFRDFIQHAVTEDVRHIAFQTGGRVVGNDIVVRSSAAAWADAGQVPLYGEGSPGLTGDMKYSDSEEKGVQGAVLAKPFGEGRIVVIADQNAMGDACISVADNWRLWLNAVKWAGRIELEVRAESFLSDVGATKHDEAKSLPTSDAQSTGVKASRWIDEFDKSASTDEANTERAEAAAKNWSLHCWESPTRGNYRWSGMDRDQYYGFFCWLNRYRWCAAGDRVEQPREHLGLRPILFVLAEDLASPDAKQTANLCLQKNGKLVVLTRSELSESEGKVAALESKASDSNPSNAAEIKECVKRSAKWESLQEVAKLFGVESQLELETLITEPIPHWSLDAKSGRVILLPLGERLSNLQFLSPDVAPDRKTQKWERQLLSWLFD